MTIRFQSIVIFLAVTISMIVTACCVKPIVTMQHNTAMNRILKSGKIRCGYLVCSPYFRKDPNSGKLSGIFYDVMEEIGKNSGFKIEWTEEVGYENVFPGLDAGRYDVFGAGLWPNALRAKGASFTIPIFYSAVTAWCRPNDNRFDKNLDHINSPSVHIATIDGAMEDIIAKTDFPKAKRISLPELSPFSQNFENIVYKKADLTFAQLMLVNEFLAKNPGTLKQIMPDKPVRIFGNSLVVKKGETDLKEFLDVALREIIDDGYVEKILKKYESVQGTLYPVAQSYMTPYNYQSKASN